MPNIVIFQRIKKKTFPLMPNNMISQRINKNIWVSVKFIFAGAFSKIGNQVINNNKEVMFCIANCKYSLISTQFLVPIKGLFNGLTTGPLAESSGEVVIKIFYQKKNKSL